MLGQSYPALLLGLSLPSTSPVPHSGPDLPLPRDDEGKRQRLCPLAKPTLPAFPVLLKGQPVLLTGPHCVGGMGGPLPVQERWCRLREAQVLVSSSTKVQVSSHSCSGLKVQNIHKSPGKKECPREASKCNLHSGESLTGTPRKAM